MRALAWSVAIAITTCASNGLAHEPVPAALLQSVHGETDGAVYIYDGLKQSPPVEWVQPQIPSKTGSAENWVRQSQLRQVAQETSADGSAPTMAVPAQVRPVSKSPLDALIEGMPKLDIDAAELTPKMGVASDAAILGAVKKFLVDHLRSLTGGEWESGEPLVVTGAEDSFVTADGAKVQEIGGLNSALLREFGCRCVVQKTFTRPQRKVTLSVFYFGDSKGAFGSYTTMRAGSSTIVKRGDASSEDDDSISFLKGVYFVQMVASAGEDEVSKQLMSTLANKLSDVLPNGTPMPKLMAYLPALDKIAGSEKFFMGPLIARRHLPMPHVSSLSIEKSKGAAFAEYQYPHPQPERLKLLLVDFGDAKLAKKVYDDYLMALSSIEDPTLQYPSAELFRLKDGFLLCRLKDGQVAIISGARRKYAPFMLSRQLDQIGVR